MALRFVGRLGLCAASLQFVGASCAPTMLGVMPGVLNGPENYSLRRGLLDEALRDVCGEFRGRSTPFRFHDEDPVVGRFFATRCSSERLPNGDLSLDLAGSGYVWTNLSRRLGFEGSARVVYDVDFQLDGSTTYVYFRPKAASPPRFVSSYLEMQQSGVIGMLLAGAPGQSVPDRYGAQVMALQLQRGFTVIRDAQGGQQVGIGVVPPGERPPGAFVNLDPNKAIFANERVELHANGRDFAGPFEVPAGKRLDVMVGVEGAAAIDAIVVARPVGDAWLAAYTHAVTPGPTPGPEMVDDVVQAGSLYRRSLPLPPGQYYLVLDNTPTAGRATTLPSLNDRVVVSYAVTLD